MTKRRFTTGLVAGLCAVFVATTTTAPVAGAIDPLGSIADTTFAAGNLLTDDTMAPEPAPDANTIYPDPMADPFYHAPENLADLPNGALVRQRPGHSPYFAEFDVRQYAFKSLDSQDRPILATSLVVRPHHVRPDNKIISYQHFINALHPRCSPGNTLQNPRPETALDSLLALLRMSLSRGSVVNIPDHLGPNSAYVVGRLSGHIVLDSLRALTTEPGQNLGRSPIALLGYSGGGLATGFTAAMADDYAPELDIVGAAQGGVPTDLMAMATALGDVRHPFFGLALASAVALSREYPDSFELRSKLSPLGHEVLRKVANSCQLGLVRHGYKLGLNDVAPGVKLEDIPGLTKAYRDNSLDFVDDAPNMPVYMWHARQDGLVPFDTAVRTARRYCEQGTPMTFGIANGSEHLFAFAEKGPEWQQWIEARFRGEPAPTNCGTF